VVMQFAKPDASLRRRLIAQRWHADILAGIDVGTVVDETDGLSFAELEEAKKLLVMHYMETGRWDWPRVSRSLQERAAGARSERPIGFHRNNEKSPTVEQPALGACAR